MRYRLAFLLALVLASCATKKAEKEEGPKLLKTDHFVIVKSTAPALAGKETRLYVREVSVTGVASKIPAASRVVLFVHASGTPAEVAFDLPYKDYSWMTYLAGEGFDAFSLSHTGYGRSTRPAPMNDICNLSLEEQKRFIPAMIPQLCEATWPSPIATMGSEWQEIDAVVDHVRKLRSVSKVSIVAWSQGGVRAGGYAARHPDKVSRLFVLAPTYTRDGPSTPPSTVLREIPMSVLSHENFDENWKRQSACANQFDSAVSDAVWEIMLDSDPVGAKWGPGVRRAPIVRSYGFNKTIVAKMQTPIAMVSGQYDGQVSMERVRTLYEDAGSKEKVLIDLACSSHNALWEGNRLKLFKASLEWLRDGKVNGTNRGELKLGY